MRNRSPHWIKHTHLFDDPEYKCSTCGTVFVDTSIRCPACNRLSSQSVKASVACGCSSYGNMPATERGSNPGRKSKQEEQTMKTYYGVTGAERKRLVQTIEETLEIKAKYLGMPSCAFQIGDFTVTKDGTLEFSDRMESEKYAFRIFLLKLGFSGPEHKEVRRVLLQRLSGHSAFRNAEEERKFRERRKGISASVSTGTENEDQSSADTGEVTY